MNIIINTSSVFGKITCRWVKSRNEYQLYANNRVLKECRGITQEEALEQFYQRHSPSELKMKRYDPCLESDYREGKFASMEVCGVGEYVRYDDAIQIIKNLESTIRALRGDIQSLAEDAAGEDL